MTTAVERLVVTLVTLGVTPSGAALLVAEAIIEAKSTVFSRTGADRTRKWRDEKRHKRHTSEIPPKKQQLTVSPSVTLTHIESVDSEVSKKKDSKINPSRMSELGAARVTNVTDAFEHFWKIYPSRGSASNPKKPARDKFSRAVLGGVDPDAIIAAAGRYGEIERGAGRMGTSLIAQAATWLNQQRWNDYPAPEAAGAAAKLVFVRNDTLAWQAWCKHLGKTPPVNRDQGWYFESEFPPSATASRLPVEDPIPDFLKRTAGGNGSAQGNSSPRADLAAMHHRGSG